MDIPAAPAIVKRLRLRLPIASAAAVVALVGWSHHAHAATLHHAALVVEHSSGRLLTRCVGFLEDQISGLQLIQRSGIEYQTQQFGGLGSAICQLDYEPQPIPSGCFGGGAYWQYFHRAPNGWIQSGSGADSWSLHDGDMDGWRYASGAGQAPVNISFSSVCAPAAPSATVPATSHAPVPTSTASRTAARQPAAATVPSTSATATATATAPLQAIAPTVSNTARTALAETGSTAPPPSALPIGPFILIAVGVVSLLALAVINIRRRGP